MIKGSRTEVVEAEWKRDEVRKQIKPKNSRKIRLKTLYLMHRISLPSQQSSLSFKED